MGEPLLNATHRWPGRWWLPGSDDRVAGTLTYDPENGPHLELIGGWEYRIQSEPFKGVILTHSGYQSWPVVYGESRGKQITLLDVHLSNANSYRPAGTVEEMILRAHVALVGCHVDSEDDAIFTAAIATVENLTAWSGMTRLVASMGLDENDQPDGSVGVSGAHAGDQHIDVGDDAVILHHVYTDGDFDYTRAWTTGRIKERVTIEFAPAAPQPYGHFWRSVRQIEDLLSLCSQTACAVITFQLKLAPSDRYPEGDPRRRLRRNVDVFGVRLLKADPDARALRDRDFVLKLADVPATKLFPLWADVRDRFAAASEMVLGLRYITDGFTETRLITSVSAAEALHRALDLEPPMPREEFEQLRESLLSHVAPERRDWLDVRIQRNEPSLRRRLLNLVDRLPDDVGNAILPRPRFWADAALRSRDSLVHTGQSDAASLDALHAVAEVTAAIVVLNLVHELGAPPETLARALREHPALSHAVSLAKEHFASK